MPKSPIMFTKESWQNGQLSLIRHYNNAFINGEKYQVIPPFDDLVASDWVKVYKVLGRERFIEIANEGITLARAKELAKEAKSAKRREIEDTQMKLF